jgi:phage terminase large subunit
MSRDVEIDIIPRESFREYLTTKKRWLTLVCHRRAGKTVASVQRLVYCALTHKREGMDTAPLRYAYIAPTRTQAKGICWGYFRQACATIPDIKINESELTITFPNRAKISLFSGEGYESMRGQYFDGCIVDEADDVPSASYKFVILPCLLDYRGWLCTAGTPKGRGVLYRNVNRSRGDDKRFCLVLKASKSGIIPQEDLDVIKHEIGEEAYQQEMECDFTVAREGAIYASHLQKAKDDGRVFDFEPDQSHLTYSTWDLGSPSNTVVSYWQKVNLTYRLIDCDYNLEMTTAERVAHMLAKGYNYGQHFLPHDGRTRGADNMSFHAKLTEAGLPNVVVLDNAGQGAEEKRIRNMHDIFPQIYFNDSKLNGESGMLDALMDYHYKETKKDGRITSKVDHGYSSHFCDSFGYFSEALLSGRMMDNLSKRGIGRAKASLGQSMRR